MLEYPETRYKSSATSPLSQVVKAGGMYFISGQISKDYETKKIVGKNVTEQAEQVMKNIGVMLESLDLDYSDVAKTTCYLTDSDNIPAFNEVYKRYFINKPSRVCLTVRDLPSHVLCEVECIAFVR